MVVDDAACLVLVDLDEPRLDELAAPVDRDASRAGQVAGQVGDEPPPHLRRGGVEHHGGLVVVAVGAHRAAEPGVVRGVPGVAGDVAAVRAGALGGVAAGAAGQDLAVAFAAGMDRAEGGGGEGGEHARVLGDRAGDALAAGQAGQDDVAGVALVDRRAVRADFLAAVAAVDVQRVISPDRLGKARSGGDLELSPGPEDIRNCPVARSIAVIWPDRRIGWEQRWRPGPAGSQAPRVVASSALPPSPSRDGSGAMAAAAPLGLVMAGF